MARGRTDRNLARFKRIALVLSGGAALGAYQAGAYAALERRGVRPNWIAGTAIGAINAAIVAGNLPHERVARLRQFWRELSRRASSPRPRGTAKWARSALRSFFPAGPRVVSPQILYNEPVISAADLRVLIGETVDFSSASVTRRWRAGETDVAISLAHPRWLAPPSRLSGIVVHEVRGGLAAPPR